MIPYNNSIIVPVDTGYGNIKNSLHSFPTGIAAYKTKPNLKVRFFISEICTIVSVKVTRSIFPTRPLTRNFVC